jgi:ABC-2 type transport system permease protein
MKVITVIKKSIKEQLRHFWIFILTITMAPFFVFVYYLINEASKPHYDLLIVNQDKGIEFLSEEVNYGNVLIETIKTVARDSFGMPLTVKIADDRAEAMKRLKNRKADALIILPDDFSERIHNLSNVDDTKIINIEFIGDLTNVNYMVSAIFAHEILNEYVFETTQRINPIKVAETSLGMSGKIDEFDLWIPGLLILSVIMLMFSAAIAIINEVENKTIIRLKLSKVSSFELLSGISIVQVMVGLTSVCLTLAVAVSLGFDASGSFGMLIFITVLTSISIIAFSLIVAAITKTANEVLVVANFPLFLFMFFTGAAFPMKGKTLFSIASYPVTIQGLMSPTHAVSALKKVMIMDMGLADLFPEIIALIFLTLVYFVVGVWGFRRRHMKVD